MARPQPALAGAPHPDRRFYAQHAANGFGRLGMRIFSPDLMSAAHTHGHVEINYLTAGRLHYTFDGRPVATPSRRLVIFWAGVPHRLLTVEDAAAELCNIYLPLDTFLSMPNVAKLRTALLRGAVVALPRELCSWDTLQRWYDDYRTHGRDGERVEIMKMEINAIFRRACVTGFDTVLPPWGDAPKTANLGRAHVAHVIAMINFVLGNLSRPIDSNAVAAVTGLHTNYASALFTRVMHVSPMKFVTRMRLLQARALLMDSDLAIAAVAAESGFSSLSQFYAHFKAAYGITPNQARLVATGAVN